jgi:hypothetical protein
MRRRQFRLWHLTATIGIVALMAAGFVWLFPPASPATPPGTFDGWRSSAVLNIAGYQIRLTSSMLWVIVGILLTIIFGIIVVCVTAVVLAARAPTRARSRNL